MRQLIFTLALLSGFVAFAQEAPKKDTLKTETIKEVVMSKKVFKKESDRFVYDVANSPVAKGSTTFDLLKQTPLISTTDDKTLKIAGKNNVLVFINGRKTNMDSESLDQFLKNTPAENIQKIEVITVPGSEFQVESSDGIINIVLKKKMTDGTSGNMRMGNTQGKMNNQSAAFSLNYRKDKLAISGSLMGNENTEVQSYDLRNGNNRASTQSTGMIVDPNKNIGGYLNADYQLTEKSNIALTWNTWANRSYDSRTDLFNMTKSMDALNNSITNYSITQGRENARSYNNSVNLNYEYKIDDLGSKFNANASYLIYRRFQNATNRTIFSDQFQNVGGLSREIAQNLPQLIDNFSTNADYIKKFKNDFTVAVGGNYNKTKTDNDTQNVTSVYDGNGNLLELFDSNGQKIDNPKSEPNHFIYDENIYGLYLTLEKKLSEKFSGKIGTRYEITKSLGSSDNAQNPEFTSIERNYNNILPYLSFNYAINDKNNLSYAFSSRMRRPSFWELNPVRNILTENNYVQNNPFVKASSVYTNELTYMLKNSYFLILNHSFFKDVITQVPLQREIVKDGITYQELRYIRTNFGDKQEMSAMLGLQKNYFKGYLNTNFNIGVQHNINNGSLSQDPTTGDQFKEFRNTLKSTSLVIQTNNTIQLDKKKTWFLGVNYWYVDQQQIELGLLKNLMSLDLNIKKVWNDWTFTAGVDDVLKTNIVEIENLQDNGDYNYVKNNEFNQQLKVSIVYNFGNKKVKKVRDIEGAADAIKNRTR